METSEIIVEVDDGKLELARKQVEMEIAQDPNGLDGLLNNFHCWVPGGINRNFSSRWGSMDKTLKQSRVESGRRSEISEESKNSDLRLNQTDRQFYETIDKALKKEGFVLEDIKNLNDSLPWGKELEDFHKKMLPVYIRLRAMGYSREDLHT